MKGVATAFAFLAGLANSSATSASEDVCYDLKVEATPISQIPSDFPDDDPDVIVISWPWFVDLKIKRVLEGAYPGKSISTLAVLHGAFPAKKRMWFLRRNSAGSFNVIRQDSKTLSRCDAGIGDAKPYLVPPNGKTYNDLRREAEAELDRMQSDEN